MYLKTAFLSGYSVGRRQWRIAAIVYFFQLCLALTLGMQVYNVLEASIGNSLEINKLVYQYDHTVLTDFLKVHGASITPLIGQLRWLLLVWLLFAVFIDAGLLVCAAAPERASGQSFWQGGAAYFFPFLKISLAFLALSFVWTALVLGILGAFFEPSLHYFSNEKYTIGLALLTCILWIKGLAIGFVWSVLSRQQRLKTGASVFTCIRQGARVFSKNKLHYISLLGVFATIQIVLIAGYFVSESHAGMVSSHWILVFFIVQQAFVFVRIMLRQMLYIALVR